MICASENMLKLSHEWLVMINTKKTKSLSLSHSRDGSFPPVHMGPLILPEASELCLLGLDSSPNLSWETYILGIAKSASIRVGFLDRAQKYLPSDAILYL